MCTCNGFVGNIIEGESPNGDYFTGEAITGIESINNHHVVYLKTEDGEVKLVMASSVRFVPYEINVTQSRP